MGKAESLIIILIIILILFGGKKLPQLAKGISASIKEIRKGFGDDENSSSKKQDDK